MKNSYFFRKKAKQVKLNPIPVLRGTNNFKLTFTIM